MTRHHAGLLGILVLLGAGWGITPPLNKVAVTGGLQPLGIIFWEMVLGAAFLALALVVRGRRLPVTACALRMYLAVAAVGTMFPGLASYTAAFYLPSGIMALFLSLVPMFSFPIAMAMGMDRFNLARFGGLFIGLCGVLMIVGPEAGLPDRAMLAFVPLALVPSLFYAFEGNMVASWGEDTPDAISLLCGSSIIGAIVTLPLSLVTGQWISPLGPYEGAHGAVILNSVIHAVVYTGYLWVVARAGAVFAAQVSYLVTGFGVIWSMVLLGERYSGWVWGAMCLLFIGLFLVQPRGNSTLVHKPAVAKDMA